MSFFYLTLMGDFELTTNSISGLKKTIFGNTKKSHYFTYMQAKNITHTQVVQQYLITIPVSNILY